MMKTFKGIRAEGQRLYKSVGDLQAKNEGKLNEMRQSGMYAPDYLLKCKAQADSEVQAAAKAASKEFAGLVNEAVSGKRVAINKMLTTPPTADQMNLLNSLQYQGTALDPDEVKSIAAQLMGNYRASHALQVMAEGAGIKLHFPAQYDYQQMTSIVNRVEKYLMDRVHDLETFTGWRDMHPLARLFYGAEWSDNYYDPDADVLDSNEQTIPGPIVENRTLSATELAFVEALFSNTDPRDLQNVMEKAMQSAELRTLIRLHPEYGKLLN